MGNRNKISSLFCIMVIIIYFIFCEGCTHTERLWREATILRYRLTNSPGEKMLSSYKTVLKEHSCQNRESIFIESFSFGPSEVNLDEELFNRFIYTLCYRDVVYGSIIRRVILNTETIVEKIEDYHFKPGRHAVTAYLHIPPQALLL